MRKGEQKFDRDYENKIVLLAENRIKNRTYKVFDERARIIRRIDLPEGDNCLVICNGEGLTIVIDSTFEHLLKTVLNRT